jgi:hypothetical protein
LYDNFEKYIISKTLLNVVFPLAFVCLSSERIATVELHVNATLSGMVDEEKKNVEELLEVNL